MIFQKIFQKIKEEKNIKIKEKLKEEH